MMSAPELTPMVLSLALALLALTGTTDGAITCEAVTTRYESTVTCFFGTDIFDTRHNFNLQFYYPDLKAKPETPLMCNWVTAENMDCRESQGVVYNRVLADQITVKGPADLRRAGGKYVCQVLPSLDVPVNPCTLTFRDVTTTTTTTTQPNALEDLTDKVTTTLILCGLVLTLALIILIAVLFIVCNRVKLAERIRKWRMWKNRGKTGKTGETTCAEAETYGSKMPLLVPPTVVEMNEVKVGSGKVEAGPLPMKEMNEVKWGSGKVEAGPHDMKEVKVGSGKVEAGPHDMEEVNEVTVQSGTVEAGLLHMRETPRPSSSEAGPSVDPRTKETKPARKKGDKKEKWWWLPWKSSSSAPKAQPEDRNKTGTGDPLEVIPGNKDKSSGKRQKPDKKKEEKGEREMESPGPEQAQRPASTVDGREKPRGRQPDQ